VCGAVNVNIIVVDTRPYAAAIVAEERVRFAAARLAVREEDDITRSAIKEPLQHGQPHSLIHTNTQRERGRERGRERERER